MIPIGPGFERAVTTDGHIVKIAGLVNIGISVNQGIGLTQPITAIPAHRNGKKPGEHGRHRAGARGDLPSTVIDNHWMAAAGGQGKTRVHAHVHALWKPRSALPARSLEELA